ncbi:MAG: hypothetical protein ACE5H9_05670, partial [Anaerolineae bacterium]
LRTEVADLRTGQEALRAEVADLRTGQESLRTGQEALRTEVADLRTGQEALRAEVADLRTGQESLRTGQEALRTEVADLRTGQESLQSELNSMLEIVQHSMQLTAEEFTTINRRLERIEIRVESLDRAMINLERHMTWARDAIVELRQELSSYRSQEHPAPTQIADLEARVSRLEALLKN